MNAVLKGKVSCWLESAVAIAAAGSEENVLAASAVLYAAEPHAAAFHCLPHLVLRDLAGKE